MTDEELRPRVLALRAQGRSPKEIAQALGVRPSVVAALVRTMAARTPGGPAEPALVGCWVSPGWRAGLTVPEHADWPDGTAGDAGLDGLVAVLVAREHRYDKVSVCGCLTDVYCLGIKAVVGPRAVARRELAGFVERYFEGYPEPALEAPIQLARELVWGAVAYARGLGFEPAAGFEALADHLGPLEGDSSIAFGRAGRPTFVQRPQDDAAAILRTLEGSVGKEGFDVLATGAGERRQAASQTARPGRASGGRRPTWESVPGSRQWRTRNR